MIGQGGDILLSFIDYWISILRNGHRMLRLIFGMFFVGDLVGLDRVICIVLLYVFIVILGVIDFSLLGFGI